MFKKFKEYRQDRICLLSDIKFLGITIECNTKLEYFENNQIQQVDGLLSKLSTSAIYDLYSHYSKYCNKLVRVSHRTYSLKKLNIIIDELELTLKKIRGINNGYGFSDNDGLYR